MAVLLALSIGVLAASSVYLFLSKSLPKVVIGFVLLGTAANVTILAAGRVGPMLPPLVDAGALALPDTAANPLPQALILTAIVIGFGLSAFAVMLVMKAYEGLGTLSAEEMEEAERPTTQSDDIGSREAKRKAA